MESYTKMGEVDFPLAQGKRYSDLPDRQSQTRLKRYLSKGTGEEKVGVIDMQINNLQTKLPFTKLSTNMRGLKTILFLFISNTFMTFAWYGHLKFKDYSWGKNLGLLTIILISWGLAFFEYVFQVPANRAGSRKPVVRLALFNLKPYRKPLLLPFL